MDTADYGEVVRNTQFIVKFTGHAPADEGSRMDLINEIAGEYGVVAKRNVVMFNGAYAITLSRTLDPEVTAKFLQALEDAAEVDYAQSDGLATGSGDGSRAHAGF